MLNRIKLVVGLTSIAFLASCAESNNGSVVLDARPAADYCVDVFQGDLGTDELTNNGYIRKSDGDFRKGNPTAFFDSSGVRVTTNVSLPLCTITLASGTLSDQNDLYKYLQLRLIGEGFRKKTIPNAERGLFGGIDVEVWTKDGVDARLTGSVMGGNGNAIITLKRFGN